MLAGVVLAVGRASNRSRAPIRQSADSFRSVFRRPRHRHLLFGGATALTAMHCLTLWAVLRSVGAMTSLADCTIVYLAAAAVGAVSPTPGGIEGTLVTGLSAAATSASDAAAAVLLYHVLSLWVPVAPGAVAFALMRRRSLL